MGFFSDLFGYFVDAIFWLIDIVIAGFEEIKDFFDELIEDLFDVFDEDEVKQVTEQGCDGLIVDKDTIGDWVKRKKVRYRDASKQAQLQHNVNTGKASLGLLVKDDKVIASKVIGSEKGFGGEVKEAYENGETYRIRYRA